MIEVKYKLLSPDAAAPEKAHESDAGFDLRTPMACLVPAHSSLVIDTGVMMLIPEGYVGFLKSKSGLNVNDGITGEGVIDAGYTGAIVAKLYNDSDIDKWFNYGDKIIQIVILPIPEVQLTKMYDDEEVPETDRGAHGFGSTGV